MLNIPISDPLIMAVLILWIIYCAARAVEVFSAHRREQSDEDMRRHLVYEGERSKEDRK